jgi:hypothetical protein
MGAVHLAHAASANPADDRHHRALQLEGQDADGRRIWTAEMTMTDPKFYTPPVVATKRRVEVPNGQLLP